MASEEIIISPDQNKTPTVPPKAETPGNLLERPERSSSPEDNCSICLNDFENKSFTDSCFHKFCFVCILEWSKVKAVCPLCKTSFKSIIHNIQSNEIYEQYHLQPNTPPTEDQDGRRFRYRTTLTDDHRYAWELRRNNAFLRITSEERRRYQEQRLQNQRNAAYNYRRYIYAMGLRARQTRLNRFSGYRDVSLDFFRRNPATVYRLVPWVQRDLSVIFNGDQNNVMFVTDLILSLIQRVDIQTQDFKNNLQGFLLNKTEHFVHEFINFARSPYDVQTYDQMAQYNLSRENEPPVNFDEPLLVISSDSDSDIDVVLQSPIDLSAHSREENLPTHNPFPPVESEINIAPGTSGTSSLTQNPWVKQEKNCDDNTKVEVTNDLAESDVEIIGYLKPYHERTPDVVVLSSDPGEEQPTCRKCGQPKHASKCKKIKRKPKTAKSTSSYQSYRRSSSPRDYHRSSRSRSRSQYTRGQHDRYSRSSSREIESRSRSRSRSITRTSSKLLLPRKRSSKYNRYISSSSSANYSSDTDGYSKRYQMSNYSKARSQSYKSNGKSQRSTPRSCIYSRSERSPSTYKPESRSQSRSVRSRSPRSRSRSRSISHTRSDSRLYRSPIRPYRSHSRSHSRSKSRSRRSHRSQSFNKSRSHDRELSWLDGISHLKCRSWSSDGKNSNVRDRESKKRHRTSGKKSSTRSRRSRSTSISRSHKKKIDSRQESRSVEGVAAPTNSVSHRKKRSMEKQERRKRREKRRLERRKKSTGDSKDVVVIDLTESTDEKTSSRVQGMINEDLLFEEEVLTMNQSENVTSLALTSGVGPMRAMRMLPDNITQAREVESLAESVDVEDDLLARAQHQPLEPVRKTAFDLLIEAEKIRLQEMLNKKDYGNCERYSDKN